MIKTPVLLVLMLIVGFILGYAINSQSRIDAAYNKCAVACNEIIRNMSHTGDFNLIEVENHAQHYLNTSTAG